MPRQARIDTPGALHHIICRGIERRNIFKDNTDRNRFLERLGSVLQKTSTPWYGWALTKITERVAEIFGIEKDQVVVAGKQPDRVRARGVLAYWALGSGPDSNGGWQVPRSEQIRCQSGGY